MHTQRGLVSLTEMKEQFHQRYTELELSIQLNLLISISTDEDELSNGHQGEPNILLFNGGDEERYLVGLLPSRGSDITELSTFLGIAPDAQVWICKQPKQVETGQKGAW